MTGPLDVDVDVVVVGGGIAGASAAWELAAHVRVVLVEQEPTTGVHATGRSAAMFNRTSGPPAVCALSADSHPFLASPPDGFTDHPLLGPRGLLWVGGPGTDGELAALVAKAPQAAARLDAGEARLLVPTLADDAVAGGAVHEPAAMTIDVAALLEGYLRGLRHRGGLVATSAEAVTCHWHRDTWTVEAGTHRARCRTVVNAAGAWADVVAARSGVEPIGFAPYRRTAALAALPEDGGPGGLAETIPTWPMVMDVAGLWYAEPETGGLLISPGDETPAAAGDVRPEEVDVALALERVNHALGLELRSIRRSWSGLRTFSPDRVPVVGPDPDQPRFVWLAGQGGSGIKNAPALAQLAAGVVLDDRPVPDAVSPERFRSARPNR